MKPKARVATAKPEGASSIVPAEIANGPEIRLWADPDLLARFDRMKTTNPGHQKLRDDIMISAHRKYGDGLHRWADDVGLTWHEARRLTPSCRPYWAS